MQDDPVVADCDTYINLILLEVKRSRVNINQSWLCRESNVLERVLKSTGCVSVDEVGVASESLRQTGKWANELATIRIFVIGEQKDGQILVPIEQQLEWSAVIQFCVNRFAEYAKQKSSIDSWAPDGLRLKEEALRKGTREIRYFFGLIPLEENAR